MGDKKIGGKNGKISQIEKWAIKKSGEKTGKFYKLQIENVTN